MKQLKRILIALGSALLVTAIGFVFWASTPLGPAPEALTALESDETVTVSMQDFIVFTPAGETPKAGFIFYPGGRVDYRSYAAPLRKIAEEGFLVVLLPVRLNLAFFDLQAAAPVFDQFPQIEHWAVGGHSLGGVASAVFAKENLSRVDALVLWASYPMDDSLRNSNLKALSIYGTEDMAGMDVFEDSRQLLPATTIYEIIPGGNHAQFADYGTQPGDFPALLSRAEQQEQAVQATLSLLRDILP